MRRAGFTLAEIAVTLAIVGIALLWVLEGLTRAKLTAAHTHSQKIATELALQTVGRVESGFFWKDSSGLSQGSFAEEGYPDFLWTVAFGDRALPDTTYEEQRTLPYDAFRAREEKRREDEDPAAEQPYEKVRVRVTFHPFTEQPGEIVLERWIPWKQVYGPDDEPTPVGKPGV